jgi:hypothetical protein
LLKRFGLPDQVSYQQAAEFIAKINRGEIKKPGKSSNLSSSNANKEGQQ